MLLNYFTASKLTILSWRSIFMLRTTIDTSAVDSKPVLSIWLSLTTGKLSTSCRNWRKLLCFSYGLVTRIRLRLNFLMVNSKQDNIWCSLNVLSLAYPKRNFLMAWENVLNMIWRHWIHSMRFVCLRHRWKTFSGHNINVNAFIISLTGNLKNKNHMLMVI